MSYYHIERCTRGDESYILYEDYGCGRRPVASVYSAQDYPYLEEISHRENNRQREQRRRDTKDLLTYHKDFYSNYPPN